MPAATGTAIIATLAAPFDDDDFTLPPTATAPTLLLADGDCAGDGLPVRDGDTPAAGEVEGGFDAPAGTADADADAVAVPAAADAFTLELADGDAPLTAGVGDSVTEGVEARVGVGVGVTPAAKHDCVLHKAV